MMVMLWKSVECSAKIAMTTLHRGRETMYLLPIHDLPRLICLDARGNKFVNPGIGKATRFFRKRDTKVIIKASSAAPMRSIGIFFHLRA
jgi:hypothetical protein